MVGRHQHASDEDDMGGWTVETRDISDTRRIRAIDDVCTELQKAAGQTCLGVEIQAIILTHRSADGLQRFYVCDKQDMYDYRAYTGYFYEIQPDGSAQALGMALDSAAVAGGAPPFRGTIVDGSDPEIAAWFTWLRQAR